MKKLLSVLLVMAVVMSFATVMSVSADEKEELVAAGASQDAQTVAADGNVSVGAGSDTEATGTSGKVYFEKPQWGGNIFYCHIFETKSGTAFWGWQLKKEKLVEENGKLEYDLSKLDESTQLKGGLKPGVQYSIMFSDNTGNETCALMFNTDCVGDTVKVTSNEKTFENNMDSTKHSYPIAWTSNASKYGIPLMITSVGTVQGEFVAKGTDPMDIVKTWDKEWKQYPNKASYSPQSSARDHKTRVAELNKEFEQMIKDGKILIVGGGVYTPAASSSSGSSSLDSSSNGSSDSSSSGSVFTDKNGHKVTKNADGTFTDENGNTVDASEVTETTGTVTTGQDAMPLYIGLGVMLAAAGVYFLTRKKKA